MADFLLTCGLQLSEQHLDKRLVTTRRAQSHSGLSGGAAYAVARVDDPKMWFPAENPISRRAVLLGGRIALSASEWDAAERMPLRGGLAARHLLDKWDKAKSGELPAFNGAGVAVFLDPGANIGYVRTDRIGWAPIFATIGDGPLIIGTHPDSIAATLADLDCRSPIDNITMAEFLRTGTATHPHTYYRNINQLDAAALYKFDLSGSAKSLKLVDTYWKPSTLQGKAPASRGEFIEALTHGLRKAGQLRSSARMGRPVVLLSAGADSRGILCALSNPPKAHTYTYYDEPNPELIGAKKIADAAGTPHTSLQRPTDYYISNAQETVRLSGGMWGLESGHHTGFVDEIWSTPNFGTLLTGCYADYLFKGVALNTTPKTFLGKNLPLANLATMNDNFYLPYSKISEELSSEVSERIMTRYGECFASKNWYELQWRRLSPISREGDACGRLAFWRQLPIDPILADNNVLDAYGMQSIQDKLSGIAFGMAIANVTGPSIASIPNNNYGAPVGTGAHKRVTAFLLASLRRKARDVLGQKKSYSPSGVATAGSWPNFQAVLRNNEEAREWFQELRRDNYYGLLSPDRTTWSYDNFVERDISQLMRLLTLHIWRSKFAVYPR